MKENKNIKIGDRVFVDVEPMTNKPPRFEAGRVVGFSFCDNPIIEFEKPIPELNGATVGAFPYKLIKTVKEAR